MWIPSPWKNNENMTLFMTFDKLNFILNTVVFGITVLPIKLLNDNAANDTDYIYETVNWIYVNLQKNAIIKYVR